MNHPIAPFLAIAAWFLVCGFPLAFISRAYVKALLIVGSFRATAKIFCASILWLAFALIVLLPLFGGITLMNHFSCAPDEWPIFVWFLICYVASLVPIYKAINSKHLPALQSMGFFKE